MNLQQGDVRVSELRNEARDQYFLEANDARLAAMLQPGTGWNLTGYSFKAWSQAPTAQTCHFATGLRVGSELYAECGFGRHFGRGLAESGTFFIDKPDATGHCANGLLEINHLYQPRHALNRTAAYERYLTSDSVARDMISNGWVLLPPTMCARP
jgi:hypothetical protein